MKNGFIVKEKYMLNGTQNNRNPIKRTAIFYKKIDLNQYGGRYFAYVEYQEILFDKVHACQE